MKNEILKIENTNDILTINNNIIKTIKQVKIDILKAENPTNLEQAIFKIANLKEAIKKGKEIIKTNTQPFHYTIKQWKKQFEILEKEIKETFLKLYYSQRVLVTNPKTGEIIEKMRDNKGSGLFIYKAEKKKEIVDIEKLLQNKDKRFIKIVKTYEIDDAKLQAYINKNKGFGNLPTKEIITEASAGLQYKQALQGGVNGK